MLTADELATCRDLAQALTDRSRQERHHEDRHPARTGSPPPNVVLGLMRIDEKSDDEVRTLVAHRPGRRHRLLRPRRRLRRRPARLRAPVRRGHAADRRRSASSHASRPRPASCASGPYFDFSYEHLVESVDGSLEALGTDYIDVLLLHRPDALVEPDEVARAFDELEAAGKVRAFGVSNHTPRQIELLKRSVRQPLVANQLQLSITHAPLVAQGVAANMAGLDQSLTLDGGGILDYCRLNDITVQAWSPFQAGFFTGRFLGSPDYPELNAVIDRLAAHYDVPPIAIATAWITRHPAEMQVVLGTTTPERVAGAAQGRTSR